MTSSLRFAYNTNGLQSHRLDEALSLLSDSHYHGVALTLDHMHLDPIRATDADIGRVHRWIKDRGLAVSVETGARYTLDPRRKHRPSLIDSDPAALKRRVDYLKRSLEIATMLDAESLILFSGVNFDLLPEDDAWSILLTELEPVVREAMDRGIPLGLEPEPGHLVSTLADFDRCAREHPSLGLTLDVGHVPVTEPGRSIPQTMRDYREKLVAVHFEDSHGKVHEHLPFGEGSLDHKAMLEALKEIEFQGLVAIELSRHSHCAHELVPSSMKFLNEILATI
ncbi:MAG: sugar phosphate isomerase/epimerase [Planctomycetota bacterium]|nr:sugar phosphate isomerase/epimerase [Planctomycetota bacterium]